MVQVYFSWYTLTNLNIFDNLQDQLLFFLSLDL